MATKARSRKRSPASNADAAQKAVRDSAQKIWLAGLGAFERAKTEGPKMFEALVAQGRKMGERAVGAADDAMKAVRQQADYGVGRWDKLEQVFEDRVSKSLSRLGVITSREVQELSKQVHELNAAVRDMMSGAGGKPAKRPAARKGGQRKAARKAA